jgi:hypothetical protein
MQTQLLLVRFSIDLFCKIYLTKINFLKGLFYIRYNNEILACINNHEKSVSLFSVMRLAIVRRVTITLPSLVIV